MNNNNNKNMVWAVIVILVIVFGIIFFMKSSPKEGAMINDADTNMPAGNGAVDGPESSIDVTGDVTSGVQQVSIAYADALIKYKDKRIQLDKICQATPNRVTYKDNIGIMIDNRSAQTRTVKVGATYTIKPWGFKIIVLPDVYLRSSTLLVDCDKSQNVATVLVQE